MSHGFNEDAPNSGAWTMEAIDKEIAFVKAHGKFFVYRNKGYYDTEQPSEYEYLTLDGSFSTDHRAAALFGWEQASEIAEAHSRNSIHFHSTGEIQ